MFIIINKTSKKYLSYQSMVYSMSIDVEYSILFFFNKLIWEDTEVGYIEMISNSNKYLLSK